MFFHSSIVFAEKFAVPTDRYSAEDFRPFKDHKGFYPYLCEFGYRDIADHIIDPNHTEFDPASVKLGDSIYVAVWYLDWFIAVIHDRILHPYVLITCDVGDWLPRVDHMKLIYDPKVACWFGKNMLFSNHSKFFQLPMGQFYYLWADSISQSIGVLNRLTKTPSGFKDILLYLNYTERHHGRRSHVADLFWDKSYCFNRNRPRKPTPFPEYWEEVSRSKFVLSPLGFEIDCTRTWECFVLGAIPIVEHSFLDPLYEKLPILLIHDWSQINENYLNEKYIEIQNQSFDLSRAYIDYWKNLIHQKQTEIRRGKCQTGALEENSFSEKDMTTFKTILSRHKKLKKQLIYLGNMTCLRPFQIARKLSSIPSVLLCDLWHQNKGIDYIKKYAKNKKLVEQKQVQIKNKSKTKKIIKKNDKSIFIDLTHFRHKLLFAPSQLADFSHSLRADICLLYRQLPKGNLLIGNALVDPYVQEIVQKLKSQDGINILIEGNFWCCIKK